MPAQKDQPHLTNIRLHSLPGTIVRSRLVGRWRGLVLAPMLTILAALYGSNLFSPLKFDNEKIEVWALDGQIQVRGLYHYKNRLPIPLSFSLGLPFPVDAAHPAPSTFSVCEISALGTTLRTVPLRTYHGRAVFRTWFGPLQGKWIRIDYVQGTRTENGEYILLTTRKWKRPLQSGEYVLRLGKGLKLLSSNFPLLAVGSPMHTVYTFSRSEFFPDANWKFSWRASDSSRASRESLP